MGSTDFDVIVVGAGSAGVACAATLVQTGARVALISEMPEVGWNLRPVKVGDHHGIVQHPMWQLGFNGGWWYPLARALNIPVRFHLVGPLGFVVKSSAGTRVAEVGFCASASAMVDAFTELSPFPLDPIRADLERLLDDVLAMTWDELMATSETALSAWLHERGVNPMVEALLYTLAGNLFESTPAVAAEHISPWGLFGILRGLVAGEAPCTTIKPDAWAGLLVPMAKAIEDLGGVVLRGRKVATVVFTDGRATGVSLRDGTELSAPAIAIATSTRRVGDILPLVPDAVRAAIAYDGVLPSRETCVYFALNREVVPLSSFALVFDDVGSNLEYIEPVHRLAPWSTTPGKQLLAIHSMNIPAEYVAAGDNEAIINWYSDLNDDIFPGFQCAIEATAVQYHRHYWIHSMSHGPKLPRTVPEIPGIWFVGDTSTPVVGVVGVEGAMGAGILGARDIAAAIEGMEP